MSWRLAIDVGGTFTDFVLQHEGDGTVFSHKVLTTPDDPTIGIETGTRSILQRAGLTPNVVTRVVHGTTLFGNMLIQRNGARVALLTSQGARDMLEAWRGQRYDAYTLRLRRGAPLVPRARRFEIQERVSADGEVLVPLDESDVVRVLQMAADRGAEAIAVCFLHAYRNPVHEVAVAALVRQIRPALPVSLSSDVAPQLGEFERTATTVANAYVQPAAERYLTRLQDRLHALGCAAPVSLLLSDGGQVAASEGGRIPARAIESGPAGAVLAAAHYAERARLPRAIAFDMGGTTAKFSMIEGGRPRLTSSIEVAPEDPGKKGSGLPVLGPAVEQLEIGAGGGSLAWVDSLGLLRVGPQSAGANPGPASYGRGGRLPTVTDAAMVLGVLPDGLRMGDDIVLQRDLALEAYRVVGHSLGLTPEGAARGAWRIVAEEMARAIKLHLMGLGRDPRTYTLVASGGCGPLFACDVAASLGIADVRLPVGAGTLSALGFLGEAPIFRTGRSFSMTVGAADGQVLADAFQTLDREARATLERVGVASDAIKTGWALEMGYRGQMQRLELTIPATTPVDIRPLEARFDRTHAERHGAPLARTEVVISACRVTATTAPIRPVPRWRRATSPQTVASRSILEAGDDRWQRVPVHLWGGLSRQLIGPAIIEDVHATALIPPGAGAEVDDALTIRVRLPNTEQPAQPGRLSAIDLEILLGRLTGIMDAGDTALAAAAFSTIAREGKDFGLAITDAEGRGLAFPTPSMPLFTATLPRTVQALLERFPLETLQPGDVLATNDPWLCAGHKSDLAIAEPIFVDGRPIACSACILHLSDVGAVLGDFRAWDIYEEGLLIPPVKLATGGVVNQELLAMIGANVRVPRDVLGDIGAMLSTIKSVGREIAQVARELGPQIVQQASDDLRDRTGEAFARILKALPKGRFAHTLTADGLASDIQIVAAVTVDDARLTVDFTGTSPQIPRTPINTPYAYTRADTMYAVYLALAADLPASALQYAPIDVIAPEGCILNAQLPVPVFARTRTGIHIPTAVYGALAQAIPDRVQAGCGHNIILQLSWEDGRHGYRSVHVMPKGGMGAQADRDGLSVTEFSTNSTMASTEVIEDQCPVLFFRELLPDSGGPGAHRGGLGERLRIVVRADVGLVASLRPNFLRHPAPGLRGGSPGARARVLLNGAPPAENPVMLRAGDELVLETAGGGGFGPAPHRAAEQIAHDLDNGYLSADGAKAYSDQR